MVFALVATGSLKLQPEMLLVLEIVPGVVVVVEGLEELQQVLLVIVVVAAEELQRQAEVGLRLLLAHRFLLKHPSSQQPGMKLPGLLQE